MNAKTLLVCIVLFLNFYKLCGQPGTLRTDFADNGIFTLNLTIEDISKEIAVLSDGSIILAGYSFGSQLNGVLMRISPEGDLIWSKDVNLAGSAPQDQFDGVVIKNDEIFVLGNHKDTNTSRTEINILKYDISGVLMTDFGTDGKIILSNGEYLVGFEMTIDDQDNLFVVGSTYFDSSLLTDGVVIKINADGVLDPEFGGSGMSVWESDGSNTSFTECTLINNELYVVGSYSNTAQDGSSYFNSLLVKLKQNGTPDLDFGNNGVISRDESYFDFSVDVQQHGQDHFIIVNNHGAPDRNIRLERYNLEGQLDLSFGDDGAVVIDKEKRYVASELLVKDDMGIYVCASVNQDGIQGDFAVLSFLSDGAVDLGFGNDGEFIADNDKNHASTAGILLEDGDIFVAGKSQPFFGADFVVLKVEGYSSCAIQEETVMLSGCDMVTFDGLVYDQSGVYDLHYQTTLGCDSILNLEVEILVDAQGEITLSECVPITVNAESYTVSGTYTQMLTASNGCDSLLTINIDIENLESIITEDVNGNLVSAFEALTYQWYNCTTNSIVSGETMNSFTPLETGDYALILTNASCSDTSECVNVTISGLSDLSASDHVSFYPNPASSAMFIKGFNFAEISTLRVFSLSGVSIPVKYSPSSTFIRLELADLASGLFYVHIIDQAGNQIVRPFVKE